MDGLYHAIGSSIKREYPNMMIDPKKFFNARVKKNLHICLTLTPTGDTFKIILENYPSVIGNCQLYWIRDWTDEYLLNDARHFMKDRLESEDLREKISRCMSEVHTYMLNESKQIPWAGNSEKSMLAEQQVKVLDKKKEQNTKTPAAQPVAYLPYSKTILHELMK
jgi:hypothetical protein